VKLEDFVHLIQGFSSLNHAEKIKHFGWWLHVFGGVEDFGTKHISNCYGDLNLSPPVDINSFFRSLEGRSPKQLLKNGKGYRLERQVHEILTAKFGKRDATVYVEKLLMELPQRLTNLQERAYLEECLICLRQKAYRATVVMAWNLAYDHLCYYILNDPARLSDFNTRMPIRYPGEKYPPVTKRETFMDMKESHVIEIASSANIVSTNIARILREKLTRRNMAAHPADVTTLQPTAEEVVRDLVENVVLKLH
jgi:hypothetical protein